MWHRVPIEWTSCENMPGQWTVEWECANLWQWVDNLPALYFCVIRSWHNNNYWMCLHLIFAGVDCGSLEPPPNGSITLDNDRTTFNSSAVYKCNEGFHLNGSANRMCKSNGQWSGSEPICERNCEFFFEQHIFTETVFAKLWLVELFSVWNFWFSITDRSSFSSNSLLSGVLFPFERDRNTCWIRSKNALFWTWW